MCIKLISPGILAVKAIIMLPFALACAQNQGPIDTSGTAETKMFFKNLDKLAEDYTLFEIDLDNIYGEKPLN